MFTGSTLCGSLRKVCREEILCHALLYDAWFNLYLEFSQGLDKLSRHLVSTHIPTVQWPSIACGQCPGPVARHLGLQYQQQVVSSLSKYAENAAAVSSLSGHRPVFALNPLMGRYHRHHTKVRPHKIFHLCTEKEYTMLILNISSLWWWLFGLYFQHPCWVGQ